MMGKEVSDQDAGVCLERYVKAPLLCTREGGIKAVL